MSITNQVAYMARPIVLSNGELHVGINKFGLVHDFYYPYVGLENHAAGEQLRHKVGVFVDGNISWLDEDPGWTFTFGYPHTALIGHTLARHEELGILLEFDDFVDANVNTFVRNIHVVNIKEMTREIKLYLHAAFAIGDSRSNTDTAQYLPDSQAIVHYRGRRAFTISGTTHGLPFDQHTIGLFGIENHEGSFRDAEDGWLSSNAVEHGRVDSIIGFTLTVPARSSQRVHYWITAGLSLREALHVHSLVQDEGIDQRLHMTAAWWHTWLEPALKTIEKIPVQHRELFIKSIMIIKSQFDKRGATIASTDTTMLNYSRDAYGYSWPRDGAYAMWPFIRMGYYQEPYQFFDFCRQGLHPNGYLSHKYRADGAIGSSWHPYVHGDETAPPIQEDETALVVFMFAQFYQVHRDAPLLKDFYASLIVPMADFLTEYVDSDTGLPRPSYDLWEEQFMVTTYTTAVTYAGLLAAADLAHINGDSERAVKWRTAAEDIQTAAQTHLYNTDRQVFYKGIVTDNGQFDPQEAIDMSALFGSYLYGLFDSDSDALTSSFSTAMTTFNFSLDRPGLPRYEHDAYRRLHDTAAPNWWYITTLWHAQYMVDRGHSDEALQVLDWIAAHALQSGMFGEQIEPVSGAVVAPTPLTWSHAEYVSTLLDIAERAPTS